MTAMWLAFLKGKQCGGSCLITSVLLVPAIMGAALSFDYGRIEGARSAALSALRTAVSASVLSDGKLDTHLATELYTAALALPTGQTSSEPVFEQTPAGVWTAAVTTATRLTFGGVLLPRTFRTAVRVRLTPAPVLASKE